MPRATITSKGQVTIPKEVRDRLRLKQGDAVDFEIQDDRRAIMKPLLSITALKGFLYRPGQRAATLREMDEGIGAAVAEKELRSRRKRR